MSAWTRVTDSLPIEYTDVLVLTEDGDHYVAFVVDGAWRQSETDTPVHDVIAWADFPDSDHLFEEEFL